jgi:hypothetical protein
VGEAGEDGEAVTVIRIAEAEVGADLSRQLQTRSCEMAFIVLFADDDRLYARNGWVRVTNRCSWVRIDEHVTLGLARHAATGAMMVKALGEHVWPDGEVDLLGHLF